MATTKPLKWTNIVGYGLGDMANNFAFSMGMLFLLNYYTDVAGISAAAAGTMLVVIRSYDAVIDIVVGRVIDRTRTSTRLGHFRPYLLWASLPMLLMNIAVFSVPENWSSTGKLAYAYVTFALWGTAYSFINIPYGALASVMTQEPCERSRLGAARALMAASAIIFLAFVLGPALRSAHGEALQVQLTRFTLLLAVIGMLLYFICFKTSREAVERDIQHPRWKTSLSALRSNHPLQILCLVALCVLVGTSSMSGSAMYYARYVLGDSKHLFTIILISTLLGTVVSVPLAPMLVGRFGKKVAFLLGVGVAAVAHFSLLFVPASNLTWVLSLLAIGSVGCMLAMMVMWALESDTVEYGEWCTEVRIEGLNYSVFSFARKCGQALGGSTPAFLLAGSTYIPNIATQPSSVIVAIQQGLALVPAIMFSAAFFIMCFYPLSDRRFLELVQEIKERRQRLRLNRDREASHDITIEKAPR